MMHSNGLTLLIINVVAMATAHVKTSYLQQFYGQKVSQSSLIVNASSLVYCANQCLWEPPCNLISFLQGKSGFFQCHLSQYVDQGSLEVDAQWVSYMIPNTTEGSSACSDTCTCTPMSFIWPVKIPSATPNLVFNHGNQLGQFGYTFAMTLKEPDIYITAWNDKTVLQIDAATGSFIKKHNVIQKMWDITAVETPDLLLASGAYVDKIYKILSSSYPVFKDMKPEGADFTRGLAAWRGLLMVGGQYSRTLYFLDLNTKAVLFQFAMPGDLHYICVCPSDYYVITFPDDDKIYMYDCEHNEVMNANVLSARGCLCDDDNNVIVTSRNEKKIYRVSKTGTVKVFHDLRDIPGYISSDNKSPHKMLMRGNRLYYQTEKGRIYVHDMV